MEDNKSPSQFFQAMIRHYQNRDAQKLAQTYLDLIQKKYKGAPENWKANFNFAQHQSIDNLAPSFLNMLQQLKEWQASRCSGPEGEFSAFSVFVSLLATAIRYLQDLTERNEWMIPALKTIFRSSKKVYLSAKAAGSSINKPTERLLETFSQQLRFLKSSRKMNPDTKKEVQLLVDNLQVSIYFSNHDYAKSNRILGLIEREMQTYKPEELNNFYFQLAKVSLINNRIRKAEKYFEMIRITKKSQVRLIMKYLIPCKIFLGKMCINQEFVEYLPIISAIIKGDFKTFEHYMRRFQKLWIKRGIYLLMERMRILVWRNLVKRVSKVLGQNGEKIELETISKAVKIMGGDEDANECMCIVSNLIYDGYIKGYIFHNQQKKTLVLKRGGAFPPLDKVIAKLEESNPAD